MRWKDWFDFTYREKQGLKILLLLLFSLTVFRMVYTPSPPQVDMKTEEFTSLVDSLLKQSQGITQNHLYTKEKEKTLREIPISYFPFNPNQLSFEEATQLGLSRAQYENIQNYLSKGGKFEDAEKLRSMYTISEADFDRLKDWIMIPESQINKSDSTFQDHEIKRNKKYQKDPDLNTNGIQTINLDSCQYSDLLRINCLDSSLALRIIKYRDWLGGFHSIEQLNEVWGLNKFCFDRLMEHKLELDSLVDQIPINFCDYNRLSSHPYLSKDDAREIINYRTKNGFISDLNILMNEGIISDSVFIKLQPYLSLK